MQELEERVLRIGAGLTPDYRAGPALDRRAGARHALAVRLHLELLQIRGEAMQALIVRQHRVSRESEAIDVPHTDEPEQHRKIPLERRRTKVLIHFVATGEKFAEALAADRKLDAQSDRRPQRIASAHPVPHGEARIGRDAEIIHRLLVDRHGGEMLRDRGFTEPLDDPGTRRARVRQRLQRGEGLRTDDEERTRRIDGREYVRELTAVDVRNEVTAATLRGIRAQRFCRHHRPEIRTADADIHDLGEALTGDAGAHAAAVHLADEGFESRALLADDSCDIDAIDHPQRLARRSERDVQRRPVFRVVDVLAGEHIGNGLLQARLRRQGRQ